MSPRLQIPLTLAVGSALLLATGLRAGTTNVVILSGFSYSPASLTINEGDTIIFKNTGGFHSATCERGDPNCGSQSVASSPWSSTNRFATAGTYRYRCTQHSANFTSGMIFNVTVLPQGTHLVTLTNTQFTPATLVIAVGDTVIFKNTSGTHSATCKEGDPNCGSHALQASPWSLTNKFSAAGTFHYRCLPHSSDFTRGMVMTITVEAPPTIPARLANARIHDGQVQFDVTGTPGRAHVVEGTEDFAQWTPLKTNTPPDGVFGYSEALSRPWRYYRVRQ